MQLELSPLQVLCTTSTLALGVNLPARLVVLKGTRRWTSDPGEAAGNREYDIATCLQMIGRAGRPQFDTQGTAVIMTQVSVRAQTMNPQDHGQLFLPCRTVSHCMRFRTTRTTVNFLRTWMLQQAFSALVGGPYACTLQSGR